MRAVPGASKTEAVDVLDDQSVKLRIGAPAESGKANAALIQFLGKEFAVSKRQIEIVSGQTARHKLISITAET